MSPFIVNCLYFTFVHLLPDSRSHGEKWQQRTLLGDQNLIKHFGEVSLPGHFQIRLTAVELLQSWRETAKK